MHLGANGGGQEPQRAAHSGQAGKRQNRCLRHGAEAHESADQGIYGTKGKLDWPSQLVDNQGELVAEDRDQAQEVALHLFCDAVKQIKDVVDRAGQVPEHFTSQSAEGSENAAKVFEAGLQLAEQNPHAVQRTCDAELELTVPNNRPDALKHPAADAAQEIEHVRYLHRRITDGAGQGEEAIVQLARAPPGTHEEGRHVGAPRLGFHGVCDGIKRLAEPVQPLSPGILSHNNQ